MTNEWGPPLTGEEMKALNGRIDIAAMVMAVHPSFKEYAPYHLTYFDGIRQYHLSLNHPYYMVREHNTKHPDKLMVLHNGSAKVPEDWDGKAIINVQGDYVASRSLMDAIKATDFVWRSFIAYTPKPKESEVMYLDDGGLKEQVKPLEEAFSGVKAVVDHFMPPKESEVAEEFKAQVVQDKAAFEARPEAVKKMLRAEADAINPSNVEPFDKITPERKAELREQGPLHGSGLSPCEPFPSDEAIEYVLREYDHCVTLEDVKMAKASTTDIIDHARLIQQYEPDRLKLAVNVAAEEYAEAEGFDVSYEQRGFDMTFEAFKAGAAWQKENGNG